VAMLDNISGGRMILGLGRGLARVEFDGFRIPMDESRGRFVESAQLLIEGLERGYIEHDGEHFQIPRKDIRPRPFKSFKGRTYAAAVSPESLPIMAKLGIGILIIPQKPWEMVEQDLAVYNQVYREVNGVEAPQTVCAGWVFCDEDESRAREMAERYIGGYWDTVLRHYEFASDHLQRTSGYEYYGAVAQRLNGNGDAAKASIEFFMDLQIWGTPEQCADKIADRVRRMNAGTFTGVFSYAGMPWNEAERNLRLFAERVLPRVKELDTVAAR